MPAKTADNAKRRNATNACVACKRAKLRCKAPDPNSTQRACDRCKAKGWACVFSAEPDLRAARTSLKAHVETLQTRVEQLEAQLAAAGLSPVAASDSAPAILPSPPSPQDSVVPFDDDMEELEMPAGQGQLMMVDSGDHRFHDERVPWDVSCFKFVEAAATTENNAFLPVPLPNDLHASLLDLAFKHFFNTHRLVELDQFIADLDKGRRSWFYSPFLHLAILATGCSYVHNPPPALCSDPLDPTTRGEPFANAALDMLHAELSNPRFSTIQGLMILAKWMSGVRQPHRGWIYAGIANRLCIDFGLHLDLPEATPQAYEPGLREMRQKLFWACSTYEITWSACIGRPSEFVPALARQPDLPLDGTAWPLICRLHRIAFKVYDLNWGTGAGAAVGCSAKEKKDKMKERVEKVKHLGEELEKWYDSVPTLLRWETSPMNVPDMLDLNVNYRQTLILLYKPFLLSAPILNLNPTSPPASASLSDTSAGSSSCSTFALHARKILTAACAEVAEIGEKYNSEVGLRWVPNCVLQAFFHAGAVSLQLSLLPPVPHSPLFSGPVNPEPYLKDCSTCVDMLEEMSNTFPTAGYAANTLRGMREKAVKAAEAKQTESAGTDAAAPAGDASTSAGTSASAVAPTAVQAGENPLPILPPSADAHLLLSLGYTSFRDGLRSSHLPLPNPPIGVPPLPPPAGLAGFDLPVPPPLQPEQQGMFMPIPNTGFPFMCDGLAFNGIDGGATAGLSWPVWDGLDASFGLPGREAPGLDAQGDGSVGGPEWLAGGVELPFHAANAA